MQEVNEGVKFEQKSNQRVVTVKQRNMKKCEVKRKNKKSWNKYQNKIYVQFLRDNLEMFESQTSRRKNKAFKQMSKLIRSKTSIQCKSHHQKMIYHYHSIQSIIKNLNKEEYTNIQQQLQTRSENSKTKIENSNQVEYNERQSTSGKQDPSDSIFDVLNLSQEYF